jgi:Protein of unknown function (DUF1353)
MRTHILSLFLSCPLLLCLPVFGQTPTSTLHGHFDGDLVLTPVPGDGRRMKLKENFSYTDWQGHTLEAKAGFISDGATIPRPVWSLVGGPWDGVYRSAAVVHDVGCESHKYTWRDTHRLFFEAMLDSGVSRPLALTMYWGVLVGGPRWQVVASSAAKTSKQLEIAVASEISKLSETQRKDAVVESTRTDKVINDQIVSEYSATVTLPKNGSEVSEKDLRALEAELSTRTANGEQITAEEIEKRSELPTSGAPIQKH